MAGRSEVQRRVVKINDSTILNRYWDKGKSPRPESYKEDLHLAADLKTEDEKVALYANLRAGAA